MVWFRFIATKGRLPLRLDVVKVGLVSAKSDLKAEKLLLKSYRNVLILGRASNG